VVPTTAFDYASPITYNISTPNAVLDGGLPSSFIFNADDVGGTETNFQPQSGATVFFGSGGFGGAGDGVIGWDYGSGRVISLSTLAGQTELSDANYSQLFGNAVNWVEGATAVPEPSSMVLIGLGMVGTLGAVGRGRYRIRAKA
jgi:hypothetical protein